MKFHRVSSVQNRFLLVDLRETVEHDWSALALDVCWGEDRTRAECDGLLVFEPGEPLRLRMFNPDGTEDFCGNGLICAGAYAWLTGAVHRQEFAIRHGESDVPIALKVDAGEPLAVTISLPEPSRLASSIPISLPDPLPAEVLLPDFPHPIRPVSTGTAHSVIIIDSLPENTEFEMLSRQLENHPVFPERTSVEWVQVLAPGSVRVRIWERGVGETLGCGTGSAAVAAVTYGLLHQGDLCVVSKGGMLAVRWLGSGPVFVTGQPQIEAM
ncbi:MAG: diaminopimelate epimerase [Fimbriimonadia bacterium]|jgi:diaminopimelate epimerase